MPVRLFFATLIFLASVMSLRAAAPPAGGDGAAYLRLRGTDLWEAWVRREAPAHFREWERRAEAGDTTMMSLVGRCCALGAGTAEDRPRALRLWLRAAKAGNVAAMTSAAAAYRFGVGTLPDQVEEVRWLREAVKHGDAVALDHYGSLLISGSGIETDAARGIEMLRRAAEAGYSNAMRNLSAAYFNGVGVKEDPFAAFTWAERAVAAGSVKGKMFLAHMYYSGRGCRVDFDKAVSLARQASAAGDERAKEFLVEIDDEIRAAVREKDKPTGPTMFGETDKVTVNLRMEVNFDPETGKVSTQTFGTSDPVATWADGRREQVGLPDNRAEEFRAEVYGARPPVLEATKTPELRYGEKTVRAGCPREILAAMLAKASSAAAKGDAPAMNTVGVCRLLGKPSADESAKAVALIESAAAKGNVVAMANLAAIYDTGIGVAPEAFRSLQWLRKAAAAGDVASREKLKRLGLPE